ncbi:MAG: DUF1579 domain-containing protein [Elusimicrobia bacterium]|nr:DUF1579 domain-containing protein [Elusimicrobiota bacterium]
MNRIIVLLAFVIAHGNHAFGEEKKPGSSQASPAMTQEMIGNMAKFSGPNENHKRLDPFIGRWNAVVLWWMAPTSKPEEMRGIHENRWIMGGRFMQQRTKGGTKDQPFEGLGFTGYDTLKGTYVSLWLDNMGTGIMTATGEFDAATQTFNEKGTMGDPMTGEKEKPFRSEWKVADKNHFTYTMYTAVADGSEFKAMEIQYTRAR